MGYCIEIKECNLLIRKENVSKALELLKDFTKRKAHIMFVNKRTVLDSKMLSEAMEEYRWGIESKEYGVELEYFYGENLGDDFEMFNAIAPVVEEGSYIEMHGEDGETWRWVFENGKCTKKRLRVEW